MASEADRTGAAVDGADDVDVAPDVSEVLAELAEAEAAEAEARAEAARAKATAARLRGSTPTGDATESGDTNDDTNDEAGAGSPRRGRRPRLWWSRIALAAAVLVICGLLAVTGVMVWQHRQVAAQRAHQAEFVAAARAGVTALLSIDYTHAKSDVARVIDLSTGTFRADFTKGAQDFVTTAEQSKAVTVGSIKSAALQSEDGDTAVVLLAASSTVTNANGAQQDPRAWRMSVTVARDGGQLKMSNVEFVP
ncbi:hypothetical protein B1R94_08325 [Mycolicibacterium litorale]|nr:hypothetical protein B1R94_08325 [Mycolicibacterium litorale]